MNKPTKTISYVDSMIIVDKYLNVIHTNRYNPRFDKEKMKNEYEDYHGKKYYEVYPHLDLKESTMTQCLKTGSVIYRDRQSFADCNGNKYTTRNITYPIIRFGEIVGAVELSQDITVLSDYTDDSIDVLNTKDDLPKEQGTMHAGSQGFTFEHIMTSNEATRESIRQARVFALNRNPVLIYGETGTGKEVFVEAMVNSNPAFQKQLVAQNCAAIPETLFESMLFGSKKGAFTGAEDRKGLFEIADGGVLFLDELNSMPLHLQAKLLRVIQDGVVRPVGSTEDKKVNVKIIAAVNQQPSELMRSHLLREDLFYRLSGNMITLLPLRKRKEDIKLFIDYYAKTYSKEYNKRIETFSPSLMELLRQYHWPGNVRELKHIIESMISLAEEPVLTTHNLPIYFREMLQYEDQEILGLPLETQPLMAMDPLKNVVETAERAHIEKALEATQGNVSRAAELLGIPRQTLRYRMDKLGFK